MGIVPGQSDLKGLAQQALGSVGRLTTWVGTAVGALTSLFMVMVIGLFVAMEPRIYDRGLQWMVPRAEREEFAITIDRMALRCAGCSRGGCPAWRSREIGRAPV